MMVRLSLLGLADALCLSLLAVIFSVQFERELGVMLLYLFTPFLLTCLGCLFILTHSTAANGGWYCLIFGGFMLSLQVYLAFGHIALYEQGTYIGFWLATMFFTLLAGVGQVRSFLRTCRTMEPSASPY